MPPKIFSVLAVASLALAGCSAAEPEPAPTVTVTATPENEAAPEAQASTDPTEAFIDKIERELDPVAEQFEAAVEPDKLTDDYWIELGEKKCEQSSNDELKPIANTGNPVEDELEGVVMRSAIVYLCPTE